MNPTETQITEALDACVGLMGKLQKFITNSSDEKETMLIEMHDAIYQIYQELGRL